MGEEPFEEALLQSESGTVFIRGGWGRDEVLLGISEKRSDGDPDVLVHLIRDQARRVITALRDMLPKRQVWQACPQCAHEPHEPECCECLCTANSMPTRRRTRLTRGQP